MNIVTKIKNNDKAGRVRFRTLLVTTSIILSIIFSTAYLGISIHNIEEITKTSLQEEMRVDHNRLCDSISECTYQVEKIETFVKRNGLTTIVKENLNLVDKDVMEKKLAVSQNRVKSLSISPQIVDSFLVIGKNVNQKNLYFKAAEKRLVEENFPTADVLKESGLEEALLFNWGNIGKTDLSEMKDAKISSLNETEKQAIENMVDYLDNQYFACDYVDDVLVIVKFNDQYFQEQFLHEKDCAFIIYQSLKKPTLCLGTDYEFSAKLLEKLSYDRGFFEDEDYYYNCTYNLYGNLSAVTIREKGNAGFRHVGELFEQFSPVFIVGIMVSIIAYVVTYLVSQKIFDRLRRFCQGIKRQSELHNFSLIKLDDKTHKSGKITVSNRIFISLISSCVLSLIATSILFLALVNHDVKEYAHNFADSVSERYQNQYEINYERYNGLSIVMVEKFIREFKGEDYQSNYDLIKEFEESFYYETSFLPGYSYAFIVNQNKNVLYQTMLSSQTQISNNLVNQALTQAEKYDCHSVFVPVNDFLTGEETIAYVKQLYEGENFIGNIIIVMEKPSLPDSYMNGMLRVYYLITNKLNDVLIADEGYDDERTLLFSEQRELEACLGKCTVALDYSYYTQRIRESQMNSLVIMLIMCVFCFLAAFVLKLFLIRPFNMLMNHMHSVPKGVYKTIPESGQTDEISEIAAAYNQMIVRLEELVDKSIEQATTQKELELLQAQTEFKMLQQQINPHFLFNTLEIINLTAINNKEDDISKIVQSLSYILRYAIGKTAMVKVKNEIEALEAYIDIQRYRFGDSFSIEIELDRTLFQCYIIKFIIQPIVENAILHGMKRTSTGGKIEISLSCYEEGIEFSVSDNGIGMSQERLEKLRESIYNPSIEYVESKNNGIGLKNVYRRMKLYYGDRGEFIINSVEGRGTNVILRIPFEPDEDML